MTQDKIKEQELEKAIKFHQYLHHLVRLRTSVVLDTSQYLDSVWLYQIPHHPLCHCVVWSRSEEDGDPIWIEIKRPILPRIPRVPEECIDWVELKTLDNHLSEPVLKDKIIKRGTEHTETPEYIDLSSFPNVSEQWRKYLEESWKPWAKDYKEIKEVLDIYSCLFNMYQQQKALGESYEVVVGLGLLNHTSKDGARIYRHILTAQTELNFEPNKGTITVKASPEGAKLRFETEMLDPSEQPAVEIQLNLEERLKEISDDIWEESHIHPIIRSWINSLDPKAIYSEELVPAEKDSSQGIPMASFAPAIILRKRTNIGILKFLEKVIEQIRSTNSIPPSVQVLLSIDSTKSEISNSSTLDPYTDSKKSLNLPGEIYFPLAFNEEQFKIVKAVAHQRGVLVQGPPGTGKSHTIANLICHFLAEGKRVLVTSQTARALKVLKGMLPKQMQPLCVSVLGARQEDFDNLTGAVSEITSKYYSWDKEKNVGRIENLEKELATLRKILQELKISLRELREKETYKHSLVGGKYSGTAQEIAQKLKENENRYGWIPDEISETEPYPLSQSEFSRLLDLYRQFNSSKCKELALKRVKTSELFSPEAFIEMVENEQKFKECETNIEKDIGQRLLYEKLKLVDSARRKNLLDSLKTLEKLKIEACRRPLPWLREAVYAILGDQDIPLKDLNSITQKYLTGLKEKAILADDCNISIPNEKDIFIVKADATELLAYLETGRKLGWAFFRPKIYYKIKYLIKDVLVNGRNCNSPECLKLLINFIDVKITIEKLKEAWKSRIVIPPGTFFSQTSFLLEQIEALEVILSLESPLIEAKKNIKEIDVIPEPSWHEDKEIQSLVSVLESSLVIDRMREIEERMERVSILLKGMLTNPEVHSVIKSLLESLQSRDWAKWGESYNILSILEQEQIKLDECNGLMGKLRNKAPLLTDFICQNPNEDVLLECSDCFVEAWDWLQADAWLRDFEEKHDEYQLQRDYVDYENKVKRILAELASAKAWEHCFHTMTEEQRQNLVAWSHAIQKIGKGTGKRAEKYRREAEGYMNNCRGAIPAWVMPLYRVAESITPKPEIFDVVIIDEASQCGPEALLLLYIAKKCIVVGDDQQISPEGVGIERRDVDLLIERFLRDFPLKDTYGLESSLFTHAAIRYGSRIVLQEHFRCVPEIIGFSNQLCYVPLGARLVPLRSYPPQRLTPICLQYVSGGYREGSGQNVINKPEAEALVMQIVKCCSDTLYKDKSMGVISLQGQTQARYIERLLVEKLGPEEIEKRNIICGDAYDFQGDERDVIFLSLVAATNERIGPLVKETDKRRFNVAFSRARDQAWLFHSVTVNDLNPNDYRYKLLAYCLEPERPTSISGDINIEALRSMALKEYRSRNDPPEPFDSWFEVDVFLRITEHGYRPIPQFRVAEKKIDIVIEGARDRLAVECDGDAWHGPEQYEQDQFRQRILERAGWHFWRIRGSAFYHDQEHALDPLWQLLEEMETVHKPKSIVLEKKELPPPVELQKEEIIEESPSVVYSAQENDRLGAALSYSKKIVGSRSKLEYEEIKKTILILMKEGSQGKDLIADKALRILGINCRGRNRTKFRNKVMRVVTDLRRAGVLKEYETDSRKRFKLDSQGNLFSVSQ
jgi:superfamily I DNA and/or RNA helicase/very-short-patch-repair endonuclease